MGKHRPEQVNLEQGEKKSFSKKTKVFIENVKKAIRDAIATASITVSTIIPSSFESLSYTAAFTSAALVTACCDKPDTTPPTIYIPQREISITEPRILRVSGNQVYLGNTVAATCDDPESGVAKVSFSVNGGGSTSTQTTVNGSCTVKINAINTENLSKNDTFSIKYIDNTEPKFNFSESEEINISQGEKITMSGKEVFVGGKRIFAWDSDDYVVSFKLDGNSINGLPFTLNEDGDHTFECILTNKNNGKFITGTVTIKVEKADNNQAPEITPVYEGVPNIIGGVIAKGENNKLLFGDVVIYQGEDDDTQVCTPSLKLKGGNEEKIGKEINTPGTYVFTLTDKKGKSTTVEFFIESNSVDLTSLNNLNLQVGEEVDLLQGINIPNGVQISNVEIEINGQRSEVSDPHHYIPHRPGTCYIYITEKGEFGNTYVEKSKNPLTIKDIEYPAFQSITINNIKPVDILPIIGQVNVGDKNVYSYIEVLRIAEATRIRDMLWKYGFGKYSAEAYQELMMRLNTGMVLETPPERYNYDDIGGLADENPSDHSGSEWSILDEIINYANLKVINPPSSSGTRYAVGLDFINKHPNSINIFGCSAGVRSQKKSIYNAAYNVEDLKNLCKSKNFLIFVAGTNITNSSTGVINRICNEEYEIDDHGIYGFASLANSDKNTNPDRHVFVTIATNKNGDIDQTGVLIESSRYPEHFADNVLFSGRGFPQIRDDKIYGPSGRYTTSDTNYLNVALADLCFQMCADVKDVDDLMEKIRSTALEDYIRLDGETQKLQLINPAGFFKEYGMVASMPSSIAPGEMVALTKLRYKGLVFDIPGAEVYVNGKWIPYNKVNESEIKAQNPMDLEWRLNGDLVARYSKNGLVTGKIIAVDDEWNGLNMYKDVQIYADGYTNSGGNYAKSEGNYVKWGGNHVKSDRSYIKSEGNYTESGWKYAKSKGNNRNMRGDYAQREGIYRKTTNYRKSGGDNKKHIV